MEKIGEIIVEVLVSISVIIVVKTVLVVICGENRGNNSGSVSVNECDNSSKILKLREWMERQQVVNMGKDNIAQVTLGII